MKIGILLTTSPENQNSEVVINLTKAALESGNEVNLFLMDDGVYNVMVRNKISPRFSELMAGGASLALCAHTAEERGVEKDDCLENVGFAGQYELACLVNEADRFLAFGG